MWLTPHCGWWACTAPRGSSGGYHSPSMRLVGVPPYSTLWAAGAPLTCERGLPSGSWSWPVEPQMWEAPVEIHRTSVGLDVHARSVVACGLDRTTGELFERRLTPNYQEILE